MIDFVANDDFHDDAGGKDQLYFPSKVEISFARDSEKLLAVRQCITEVNGSTAISGMLANGWNTSSLSTISIPPLFNGYTPEALVDGLSDQLAVADDMLKVDRKLDQDIDSALSKFYKRFKTSEI